MQSTIIWAALVYIAGALIRGYGLRLMGRQLPIDQRILLTERNAARRKVQIVEDSSFVLALFFLPPPAYYIFPLWALLNAILAARWTKMLHFPLDYRRMSMVLHMIYVGAMTLVVFLVNGWINAGVLSG